MTAFVSSNLISESWVNWMLSTMTLECSIGKDYLMKKLLSWICKQMMSKLLVMKTACPTVS